MSNSQFQLPSKDLFDLPEGMIYLDGNSLGPPLKGSEQVVVDVVQGEWRKDLIKAWNTAHWLSLPQDVGNQVARVIGVPHESVAMGETLSVKAYQALAAALNMRPDRRLVLSDSGNFPSDLYIAQSLIDTIDQGHQLLTPPPEEVADNISGDVAVVYLTHADYRSGRLHDMKEITARAHEVGAVMIWDLAHSAGAMPLPVQESSAEFAVGCTYKYLNGGPGAPAFIYVRPDLVDSVRSALAGWLGHKEPFAMDLKYTPAKSTERFRIGTPAIVQFKLLQHAMHLWDQVDLQGLRNASIDLTQTFIREVEAKCPSLNLASPKDPHSRGSHVSFAHPQGYAIMQALIERDVIGDFREPNLLRFGFAPLYLDEEDILKSVQILDEIMTNESWKQERFLSRNAVT